MFFHDQSPFTVEFPRGPLQIGNDVVRDIETVRRGDEVLRIIGPTAVAMDRLHKYAVWDDFSALRAAVGVTLEAAVDVDAVRDFMKREGTGFYKKRFDEAFRLYERRVRERRL